MSFDTGYARGQPVALPLLAIDCPTNRVRRYVPKRPGGRVCATDEVRILRPQCDTLAQQLEQLRQGEPIQYADLPPGEAA